MQIPDLNGLPVLRPIAVSRGASLRQIGTGTLVPFQGAHKLDFS